MRCDEGGCEIAADARGWRAMIGEEDDGTLMVATFCLARAGVRVARSALFGVREPGHPQHAGA
jgi:hypothetical protein